MRNKFLRGLLLAALISVVLCTGAMAVGNEFEMDYVGPLDIFTGDPTDSSGSRDDTGRVWISNSIQYDVEERMYVYPVGGSIHNEVMASVMDGMITSKQVSILPDAGVQLSLFFDGELQLDPTWAVLNKPGEYVVMSGTGNQSDERIFSFTIVGAIDNSIKGYKMPNSFQLMEATLNGEAVYFERSYIDLSAEGEYFVKYRCIRTDEEYELTYTADFTAPVLALKEIENGLSKGPVDISDMEDGASYAIYLDNESIAYNEVLTKSGNYIIKVSDKAGNVNTYHFTIPIYFDGNSIVFFSILVAVFVGVIVYVFVSRKRLRVR